MTVINKELYDLINDPICQLLMSADGVRTTELLYIMHTVIPLIGMGGGKAPIGCMW